MSGITIAEKISMLEYDKAFGVEKTVSEAQSSLEELYSIIGMLDSLNLKSVLQLLATVLNASLSDEYKDTYYRKKAKLLNRAYNPADYEKKTYKVFDIITEIIECIGEFELVGDFRKNNNRLNKPDAKLFQQVLSGNIPLERFMPTANEMLYGKSSPSVRALSDGWAEMIFNNSGTEFFEKLFGRVNLQFFDSEERSSFYSLFLKAEVRNEAKNPFGEAAYPIRGYDLKESMQRHEFVSAGVFQIPGGVELCREALWAVLSHGFKHPEYIPRYTSQRLYEQAFAMDPGSKPRSELLRAASDLGNDNATCESGMIFCKRDDYSVEPDDSERERMLKAASLFLQAGDNISLWNIAFLLEKTWFPILAGIVVDSKSLAIAEGESFISNLTDRYNRSEANTRIIGFAEPCFDVVEDGRRLFVEEAKKDEASIDEIVSSYNSVLSLSGREKIGEGDNCNAAFITAAAGSCGLLDAFPKTASAYEQIQYWKANNRWRDWTPSSKLSDGCVLYYDYFSQWLIKKTDEKFKLEDGFSKLTDEQKSFYGSLCRQIDEYDIRDHYEGYSQHVKWALKIHFVMAYQTKFVKSLNSISNTVLRYGLSCDGRSPNEIAYALRFTASAMGDVYADQNLMKMLEKECAKDTDNKLLQEEKDYYSYLYNSYLEKDRRKKPK